MQQIWIPKAGEPEVLDLRQADDPAPAAGEMRIRVHAAGINFADIMGRLGIYPDLPPMPVVPGYEVSGQVDAVGAGVDESWIGKEVLAMCRFGGYSDTICLPQIQVHAKPDCLSLDEAAALPVNYLTAYQLIVAMGALKSYETVLIHSAGGGVGIAAIQLAKHIGATIIGTASSGKHEQLKALGVDHCIDYRSEDFEVRVKEITKGRGVELIIDAVGGDSFIKGFRSLAPSGRIGMFGMSAAATGMTRNILSTLKAVLSMPFFSFNPVSLMDKNRGCFGVNMGHLWDESEMVNRWMVELLGLCEAGVLKPHVDCSFAFDKAADAHRYIQERKNFGKVLLKP
ncbi:MAG: synaptic vesicle VAT-1 family membrane protein [Oceanococcus sp.]